MKRSAVSVLVLALTVATGSAVAAYQDYGNGPSYDSRNDSGASYDSRNYNGGQRYGNGDPRYADSAYRANSRNDLAQVIGVQPMYGQNGAYQRQQCWNERTNAYDNGYYRDTNGNLYRGDSNAEGTVIGAIIGGVLGNQVGKGDGKTAATVGGAVIGGVIGNNIDRNNNNDNYNNNYNNNAYNNGYNDEGYDQYRGTSGVVTRCRMVNDYNNSRSINGYNVTYRYAGQTYHTVTSYRPGRTMPVRVSVMPQGNSTAYRY
jgi:uncharacterized protein YcfJ